MHSKTSVFILASFRLISIGNLKMKRYTTLLTPLLFWQANAFNTSPRRAKCATYSNKRINEIAPQHVSTNDITENFDNINDINNQCDYSEMTILPRHPTNELANEILVQTEEALRNMQERELYLAKGEENNAIWSKSLGLKYRGDEIPVEVDRESVYANSYVDLGKVDTVGFDFDHTLVVSYSLLLVFFVKACVH